MALAITRSDLSAADLRAEARRAKDGDQACRLVALAFVLEGGGEGWQRGPGGWTVRRFGAG